ncbi:MAG: peptidoglycan DD-metalloendopeptidase family protein [Chitinophagaceae bacterium]|nr:peptidoglycan DD-metalloendopeptidase family protein [Oligoflexus sp.]
MIKIRTLAIFASSVAAFSCAHRLPAPPGAQTNGSVTHEVQQGETLLQVGQQYAVAPRSIQRVNHLGSLEELKPGQLIYIPVSEKAPESADLRGRGTEVERPEVLSSDEDESITGRRAELYSQYRQLEWPLENGEIESSFGPRGHRRHKGLDIFPKGNKEIVAAQDGVVEFAGKKRGYGNVVVLNHKTYKTLYAHCSKLWVNRGQVVRMGEKIAHVGATGNARGVHLHFEYQNMHNVAMDPLPHLDRDFAH